MEYGNKRQSEEGNKWQFALRFVLCNATAFLLSSVLLFITEAESLLMLLSVPALFFLGSMISFALLIRSGGALAAVAWFMLGAGIYFGLGIILGALDPHPETIHYISEVTLRTDLIRVNLLNSSSVMLVLATATPFCYAPIIASRQDAFGYEQMFALLIKIFPLTIILSLIALGLQLLIFPIAENLIARVLLSSFYLVVPYCVLSLGVLWTRLTVLAATAGAIIVLLSLGVALLSMSKFAIMWTVLPLVAGIWIRNRSTFSVVFGVLVVGTAYYVFGNIANAGRQHFEYDAARNSPMTRLEIVNDIILDEPWKYQSTMGARIERDFELPSVLTRFSITAIQGFLVDQYVRGSPGTSLNDFWVAAIPRVLWPEKPTVTRFGAELHGEFWSVAEADSALAPTYSGEAYWNYGPIGLVLVSVLLGLEFGWLTRRWKIAASGSDPAFFLIAFPVALWSAYVESWIAASYIGGFLTIVVLWRSAHFVLRRLGLGVPLRSFAR